MHDAGVVRPSEIGAGTGPGLSLAAFRAVMTRLAHLRFHVPSSTASASALALPEGPAAAIKGGHDNDATSGGARSGWMSWGDEDDAGAAGQRPEAVQARLVRDLLSGGTGGKRQPCEKPQQDPEEGLHGPQDSESESGVVQQEIELYKWVQQELKPGIMSSGLLTSFGTRAGAPPPSASLPASNPLPVTPALSIRTDSPVPAFLGPGVPCRPPGSGTEGAGKKGPGKTGDGGGSQTAALEAAEPSESELAKVLLTFLPKREPLMRVLDYYRNLHAKEQAERGGMQKGAAGGDSGEKQKGSASLPLHLWKRFLSDFDVMPTLLGRRCAEMLYKRSFTKPELLAHPLYAKFALALAHTSLFVFRAKTVEQGAQDLLAHLHASNGVDVVRAASSVSSKPLLLVTPNELNELSSASPMRPTSSHDEADAPGKARVWDRAEAFKKNGLKKAAGVLSFFFCFSPFPSRPLGRACLALSVHGHGVKRRIIMPGTLMLSSNSCLEDICLSRSRQSNLSVSFETEHFFCLERMSRTAHARDLACFGLQQQKRKWCRQRRRRRRCDRRLQTQRGTRCARTKT